MSFCKAQPVRQGPYFPKSACQLDWAQHTLQCPGGDTISPGAGERARAPRRRKPIVLHLAFWYAWKCHEGCS
jgi:hypothetical protein